MSLEYAGVLWISDDMEAPNLMNTLCQLIVNDVDKTNKPDLLTCCYGGAEYFVMTNSIEKEFRSGIGEVATMKRKQHTNTKISNFRWKTFHKENFFSFE